MKFVQSKATTAKSKYSASDFSKLNERFILELQTTVSVEEIRMNLYSTGTKQQ